MSDFLAITAVVIAFAGLVLSGLAVVLAKRAERLDTTTGTTGLLLNVNCVLVDNLDVRSYFTNGKMCEADDPLRNKVLAVAQLFLTFWKPSRSNGVDSPRRTTQPGSNTSGTCSASWHL